MNLTIDIGNSSIKAGIFPQTKTAQNKKTETKEQYKDNVPSPISTTRISFDDKDLFLDFISSYSIDSCIISSTSKIPLWVYEVVKNQNISNIVNLDSSTPLPIKNLYKTPETLGTDRISGIVGGYFMAKRTNPVLCIDCGTAITYDFITSQGEYIGGNISPGLNMRLMSLHDYTSNLPLVAMHGNCPELGNDTQSAIRGGVINGIKHEIDGYIHYYQTKYPDIYIFFTGGNAIDFDYPSKKRIFADRNLVLKGLNIILSNIS